MSAKTKTPAKKPNKSQKPVSFWARHKRLWKWLIGILGVLIILVLTLFIWFRLSPWPGAMVIRWVFDASGKDAIQALQKHAPDSGVVSIKDQAYRSSDKDAKLDVYMPESAKKSGKKLPVVIWTHGGAWLSGDKSDWAPYFELLAKEGYSVIAPNYSLAPDKTYPTPVHQLNDAYKYIRDNADRFHADTSRIILAGDSAGSQLSAQMAAIITDPKYAKEVGITPNLKPAQLKGVVLNCGVYDMEELAHPSHQLSKLIGWGNDVTVWAYSGTRDFSDPVIRQMSPIDHVTKDFPPAFITGGNDDPLTDVQSKPFAAKLQSLDVPTTTLFYPKDHQPQLPHEYQFNLDTADGKRALKQIKNFLRDYTK